MPQLHGNHALIAGDESDGRLVHAFGAKRSTGLCVGRALGTVPSRLCLEAQVAFSSHTLQ